MTVHDGLSGPGAAVVRSTVRQARRAHSDRTLGDLLSDAYLVGLIALLYGGGAAAAIRAHLAQPLTGATGSAPQRVWLVLGLLTLLAALAWRGLRMVGPMVATAPVRSWVLATPVDRAGWLHRPLHWLLATAGVTGAAIGVLANWAGLAHAGGPAAAGSGWAAVVGAGCGVALAALAVDQQPPRRTTIQSGRSRRLAGSAIALAAGLVVVLAVVVGRAVQWTPIDPALGPAGGYAVVAVGAAVATVRQARRALPWLDRAALGGGAQLTGAAVTAAVMLDPSLFSGVLNERRWRLAGTVRSRRIEAGPRWWVLLQADLIRRTRRRGDAATFAALALLPYVVDVFAPAATAPARVVAAYLAADRLAGGLRAVSRSPSLRRILGGRDSQLRLVHLVVPGVGLVLWWALTAAAGTVGPPLVSFVLMVGVLGAVYRTATRPPMSYEANLSDTPFGPIPTAIVRQVVRGPDLVAILALIAFITGRLA